MKRLSMCIMIGLLVILIQGCIMSSTPSSPVSVSTGDSITFKVTVFPANITVQWYVDDILISGATDKSYTYSPSEGDAGIHNIMVKETSGCIFLGSLTWEVDVIPGDMIAYWPFNGNANDESENGNNGTVYGATLTKDRFGRADKAYSFDGVDDYIDIGNNVKPPLPMTVSAWVKLDQGSTLDSCIFRNDEYNTTGYVYGVATYISADSILYGEEFCGYCSGYTVINYYSDNPFDPYDNWHLFTVVFNGVRNMLLYWDGIERAGQYEWYGPGVCYSGSPGALGHWRSSLGDTFMKGSIDDVRVYDRALSATEIEALYNLEK